MNLDEYRQKLDDIVSPETRSHFVSKLKEHWDYAAYAGGATLAVTGSFTRAAIAAGIAVGAKASFEVYKDNKNMTADLG